MVVPVVACSCGNLAKSGELIDEIAYVFCTKPYDALQILLSHTPASRPIRETHRSLTPFAASDFRLHRHLPTDTLSSSVVGKNMTKTGQASKSQERPGAPGLISESRFGAGILCTNSSARSTIESKGTAFYTQSNANERSSKGGS